MADENKNQDPEEENKGASNDDDFGLPDFEFEALEDDDDDDASDSAETSEDISTESDDDLPSIDDGDLEDLDLDLEGVDLEGIEDIDLDNLDDLGDLDLEDLDLDDLDKDLEDLDKTIEDTDVPVPASAESVGDIFDGTAPDNSEEPLADDGEFYEEESFGDFDGEFDEEAPVEEEESTETMGVEPDEEADLPEPGDLPSLDDQDDFDSSIFDDDTEGLDLGSGADAAVPFAKRDLPGEYKHDEEPEEEVSQAEIDSSKSKFVKIVVLGTIMFVAIGAGFLYWNGTLFGGSSEGDNKEVAENKPEAKKPEVKKETPKEAEGAGDSKSEGGENKAETKKPAEKTTTTTKPKAEEPKTTPKQTPPKQTTTKPATTKPASSGVTTAGAATGQRHIIVGSFLDEGAALAYADKLASQGENPTIIPPFNNAPNYRVAVASFANFATANSNLERYRETYNGAWILKY